MAGLVSTSQVYPTCAVQQRGTRAGPSSDAISLRWALSCVPKRDARDKPAHDGKQYIYIPHKLGSALSPSYIAGRQAVFIAQAIEKFEVFVRRCREIVDEPFGLLGG